MVLLLHTLSDWTHWPAIHTPFGETGLSSHSILWRKSCWVLITALCPTWVNSMLMKLQFRPKSQELSQVSQCRARSIWAGGRVGLESGGAAVRLLQFSDLPPCHWLPLFAHSVNDYQKAVYLGCSPTLLHILWPFYQRRPALQVLESFQKGQSHSICFRTYPSAAVLSEHTLLFCLPIPLPPLCILSLSPNLLAWTCTRRLNCPWQVPHPLTRLF